jgi:HPt (histidine-containing phosphotransfer) domain-containing protein
MPQPYANSAYVFHERINAQYINDLYSGDYEIIAETFADVDTEFPLLLAKVAACGLLGDVGELRRAVHKIKPVLGFTGLTDLQQECAEFEKACESGQTMKPLQSAFEKLSGRLKEAGQIIKKETQALALFNSR